jgi:hypothetical protein
MSAVSRVATDATLSRSSKLLFIAEFLFFSFRVDAM